MTGAITAGCAGQAGDQAASIGRTSARDFAAQGVMAGAYDIAIACGVESMSLVAMAVAAKAGSPMAPLAPGQPPGGTGGLETMCEGGGMANATASGRIQPGGHCAIRVQ